MRKSFILFTLLLIAVSLNAQTVYTYKTIIDTYKNLVEAISLNNSKIEDIDGMGPYDIPFTFKIAGQTITHFDFEDNNFVFLTGLDKVSGTKYYLTATSDSYIQDICARVEKEEVLSREESGDGTDLEYSYYIVSVEGIKGSQILKLEVKNSGSETEFDLNESNNLSENFQIWIYEDNNMIEYRNGSVNKTIEGVKIVREEYYVIPVGITPHMLNYLFFSYNKPVSPVCIDVKSIIDAEKITTIKSSHSLNSNVYQFIPAVSVKEEELGIADFIAHTDEVASEKSDAIEFVITDRADTVVMEGVFKALENKLILTNLDLGIYFMKIRTVIHNCVKK